MILTSNFEKNNRVMPLTVLLKKQKTAIGHPIGHIFYYTSIYFFVCAWREQRTGSDVLSIFIQQAGKCQIFRMLLGMVLNIIYF